MSDLTSSPADDPLAALLREHAPAELADDGFSARTMHAIGELAPAARAAPASPAAARALAAEQRRHAAQARLTHWAGAGAIAGGLLAVVAAVVAPPGDAAAVVASSILSNWQPLSLALYAGAVWFAWREWIGLVR
jgi:hypothetical protein